MFLIDMDNSTLITGVLTLIIGLLTILYAEFLRKKEEMDSYNFRLYIYGVIGIIIGLIVIFKKI